MFSFWIKHSALIAAEKLLTPSLTVSPWDCNYDVQKQSSRQHKLLRYCALFFPVQGCCCCSSANWAILVRIHPVPRAYRSEGPHKAKSRMSLVMQVLCVQRPLLSFAESRMQLSDRRSLWLEDTAGSVFFTASESTMILRLSALFRKHHSCSNYVGFSDVFS